MSRLHLGQVTLDRWRLTCERCGHVWETTGPIPKRCAKCTSRYWNVPAGVLPKGRPPGSGDEDE